VPDRKPLKVSPSFEREMNLKSLLLRIVLVWLTVAGPFLLPSETFGQASVSTGAIRGTVQDASGGIVQGATVTLKNGLLSLERETKTQSDGTYVFPLLQPAAGYEVSVAYTGYERSVVTEIAVRIAENTVANITLSVGKLSQEVVVTENATGVDTTSATLGGVVTSTVITALPLPTRNVLDIMGTDAGVISSLVSPSGTITQGSNAFFVGGARQFSNNYILNGTDSNNYQFQTLAAGIVPIPSPDAVQEFRTQTSLYDVSTGYSAGATINLITRAGTTQYHGVVYEFLRNTVLNANDYFQNAAGGSRPVLRQNQFGGSFGGPVPHLRSVLFFFNYEGLRQANGVSGSANGFLPVLPATRSAANLAQAFGLPVSAIDPVAVNLLNAKGNYGGYLAPSGTGAAVGTLGTYTYSAPSFYNSNQYSARVDHDITSNNHLDGALFISKGPFTNPVGIGSGGLDEGYYYPLGGQNYAINDTHIIRTNLVNNVLVGYNRDTRDIQPTPGYTSINDVGMTRSNVSVTDLLPSISIANQLSWGDLPNVVHTQHAASFDIRDTLSWIKGRHSFRFGFETIRQQFNDGIYVPRGSLSFVTGPSISDGLYGASPLGSKGDLAFRDFLIGAPTTTTFLSGLRQLDFRSRNYAGFLQDDYRAISRLTLNLGIRYDYLGSPVEIRNEISNFDPSLLSAGALATGGAGLQSAFVIAGQSGIARTTMLSSNHGSISPRVGFAYDVLGNGKLAVRGGYGVYYQGNDYEVAFANSGNPPYQVSTSTTNSTKSQLLANPFPALPLPSQFPVWPTFPSLTGLSSSGAPVFSGSELSVYGIDRHIRTPYTESWNFTIQDEFLPHWTLEIGYLGSKGVRQFANLSYNNSLFVNSSNPGRFGLTTNSSANREARTRIAGISSTGFSYLTDVASSWYDALLITVSHPVTKNFYVKAAYTHSKSLDNYGISGSTNYTGLSLGNPYSLISNKGISEQNVPNRFVATYIWTLPGFKSGKLSYLLGYWKLAGISTYQNGLPGVITQSIGNTSLTGTSGYGLVLPNCQLKASGSIQSHLTNYLNSSCVSTSPLLAAGQSLTSLNAYGAAGNQTYPIGTGGGRFYGPQTRGAFYAPFQRRDDVTLSKNFPVHALGDAGNVEFRAEAFKVLNNVIFNAPASAAGASTFGQITGTLDNTGRQIQFAVKVGF
jgi:hypothetical protein